MTNTLTEALDILQDVYWKPIREATGDDFEALDDAVCEGLSLAATLTLANEYRDHAQHALNDILTEVIEIDDDARCVSIPRSLFRRLVDAVGGGAHNARTDENA